MLFCLNSNKREESNIFHVVLSYECIVTSPLIVLLMSLYFSQLCMHAPSCLALLQPPWTGVHWAPRSMGLPRQEYRNGFPFPSPGVFPNPGSKPASPALAGFFTIDSLPPGKTLS